MTAAQPSPPPAILRPCGACDVVDSEPRTQIEIGDGRGVYFHLPGSPACGQPGADPHPEIDEPALHSQYRATLEAAGVPDIPDQLHIPGVDASDPANHHAPTEDSDATDR